MYSQLRVELLEGEMVFVGFTLSTDYVENICAEDRGAEVGII